jgi:pimeloyl-ACP methyl ester carboxylesterase
MAMVEASDGVRLYVEAHGAGIPWLFSCGYCTTRENWRPQVEPLVAAGARVILWDYRGHGLSGAPDDASGYTMERVVDDIGRVLDWAAPGEAAVLAGLSFGGLASLHFAKRFPERVRGLFLAGSGPGFKKPEAQARWQAQVEKTAQIIEAKGPEALCRGRGAATTIGRDLEAPAAKRAARAIAAQAPAAVAAFGRLVTGPAESVIDDLASIDLPAMIVVGEEDAAFRRAAEVMTARLPRAESLCIPGAGHIVNIEAEAAFNAAATGFLASLAAS